MNLHHIVVDDFFEEPWELRNWALNKGFREEISPVDGMTYKGVCKDPAWVFRNEAEVKLSYLLRSPASIKLAFLRLTTERQVEADRRIVHLDYAYARHVCTVYLNPPEQFPEGSGTWILRHAETGMETTPTTQDEIDVWERDCNMLEFWTVTGMARMAWNRTIIMPTAFFHASKPVNGFGNNPTEGRMVFVAFFDI
jgi:hypothetical protein